MIQAGIKLGRYEIRSKIGEGGMGEVYSALDTELDRTVAIKILPAESGANQQRMQRFVQEAKAASALNHPNILTIHEIGSTPAISESSITAGTRFIAMEFIDGETLRQRMNHKQLQVSEVLEIAMQTASALAAAHAAGIIHRDIKPENIMVRRDGFIKVLDFGLAKLTQPEGSPTDTEAPTKALVETGAGTVMGTANYMSPEQAKGKGIDARSDLWSLGAVIYEMVAGHVPFEAETPSEVIGLILNKQPPPLARYDREASQELERIVEKALTKNREERYQTAKDLSVDLKRLRRHIDLEAEIERTVPPEARTSGPDTSGNSDARAPVTSARHVATGTAIAEPIHQASSAEYIVSEIKRHKKGLALTAAIAIALVLAIAGYFFFARRAPTLTDKDTILLADFVNTTGDPVFDGTLKQALAVQLGQSPFLNIFGDDRVRDALRLMGRPPDEHVTRDVAREICQRQGLKALLAGSISGLGSHYVITLEAINSQSGDAIAREQAEADNKEQVLKKLGEATTSLRQKLGESLASIRKFDTPIEQVTTSSLEALRAYSLGRQNALQRSQLEAIPFLKQAVELDPNFAMAYSDLAVAYRNSGQRAMATEPAQKAFDLRERVSEPEKIDISLSYYTDVTRELDKQLEVVQLWRQTYPRDFEAANSLGLRYRIMGQPEKAVEEFREAIRLNPNYTTAYANLAFSLTGLNHFDEARSICQQALSISEATVGCHRILFTIAFIGGDAESMRKQMEWYSGKPIEHQSMEMQARVAAVSGELRRASDFQDRAANIAQSRNLKEVAASYAVGKALLRAFAGSCQDVKGDITKGLAIDRSRSALSDGALALALCREINDAKALADERAKLDPKETLLHAVVIPQILAVIELNRSNPDQAIQLLQATGQYERGFNSVAYVRGLSYLGARKGAEAAQEFQKILDRRGQTALDIVYPLSHLGLARAAVLQGDTAKARKSYQDFFALWKDADADLPILVEAKKEYEKLK